MRRLFLMFCVLLSVVASAQSLGRSGSALGPLIPEGWEHQHVDGDFNNDGYNDVAVLAHPSDTTNIFAIYFGSQEGQLKLWKQYPDLLPNRDKTTLVDVTMSVNKRGVLSITVELFQTAGGYGTSYSTYVLRYQDADFFLIGKDEHVMSRNTGENVVDSYNYLTGKHQRVVDNVFDDSIKPKETWRNIPKEPLKPLGSFVMD